MPDHLFKSKDGVFYAQIAVPAALQRFVGKKNLKRSLRTKSRAEARLKVRPILKEFWAILDDARSRASGGSVVEEALRWRADIAAVGDDPVAEEAIMGMADDRAYEIEEEHGETVAHAFADVAFGRSTPLKHHVETWLVEPGQRGERRPRTRDDYRSIVREFGAWLTQQRLPETVEAVSRKVAGAYVSSLYAEALSPARIRTIVSALSSYWAWLRSRGIIEDRESPWAGQMKNGGPKVRRKGGEERPFTAEEVRKLLNGGADPALLDFMLVGALSGMRREEIAQLRVRDCRDGVFDAPGTKTDAAARKVPIHSSLVELVTRRMEEKSPDDFLFHELGEPNADGERGDAIGKRFGRYREKVGVHEREEGRRRSRVNFHSFRRWFITEALRAGVPERIVKQVVGHEFEGDVTLTSYFGGDLPAAFRECVEAVRLPE